MMATQERLSLSIRARRCVSECRRACDMWAPHAACWLVKPVRAETRTVVTVKTLL